jgi:hypothetical protein
MGKVGPRSDLAESSRRDCRAESRRDLRTQPGVLTPGSDFKKRTAPNGAVEPVPRIGKAIPNEPATTNLFRPFRAGRCGRVPGVETPG